MKFRKNSVNEQGYQSSMTLAIENLKFQCPSWVLKISLSLSLIQNQKAVLCQGRLYRYVLFLSGSAQITCVCSLCSYIRHFKSRKRPDTKKNVSHFQTFEFISLSMHEYLQFLSHFLFPMGKMGHKFCKVWISSSLPTDAINQIRSRLSVRFWRDALKSKCQRMTDD